MLPVNCEAAKCGSFAGVPFSRRIRDMLAGCVFLMLLGVSVVNVAMYMVDLDERHAAGKRASRAGMPPTAPSREGHEPIRV